MEFFNAPITTNDFRDRKIDTVNLAKRIELTAKTLKD